METVVTTGAKIAKIKTDVVDVQDTKGFKNLDTDIKDRKYLDKTKQ